MLKYGQMKAKIERKLYPVSFEVCHYICGDTANVEDSVFK